MQSAALADLAEIAGAKNFITGDDLAQRDNGFWDAGPSQALCIVTPVSTEHLQNILECCHRHKQPMVIQGGLTGVVKGQQAQPGEVAISLERMASITDFDPFGKTVTVEAGCTMQQVQEFAREKGLLFPVDIGARGSCTIGGNIATNAGGMEVLRYGMMRNQVLGLEGVLADGAIVNSMNRMQKNNTGYDLKQLFIGSEGTLGVVTKAVLQLKPLPESCETALIACDGLETAMQLLDSAQRSQGDVLTRFEIMDGCYYKIQTGPGNYPAPIPGDHGCYVLIEIMGHSAERDRQLFHGWLEDLLGRDGVADVVIAQNQRQRQELWQLRESFEVALEGGTFFLYDVSLPIPAMPGYLETLRDQIYSRWPDAIFFTLGHMADGNLHFFLCPRAEEDDRDLKRQADAIIYDPLKPLAGSVSAEHGIGMDKKHWLGFSRNKTEIALMKTLKRALDPENLLNPGRLFDL